MNCPNCKAELIWGGDHSYEDYGNEEEEGMVSNYSCSTDNCTTDLILLYQRI